MHCHVSCVALLAEGARLGTVQAGGHDGKAGSGQAVTKRPTA